MTEAKVIAGFELPSAIPIIFDSGICNGCNKCVYVCVENILLPNPEKGKPPIVTYPGECYYDGACIEECPHPGAIKMRHPLMQRVRYKRKETDEHFRT